MSTAVARPCESSNAPPSFVDGVASSVAVSGPLETGSGFTGEGDPRGATGVAQCAGSYVARVALAHNAVGCAAASNAMSLGGPGTYGG
jgi:hypothetical protein